MTPRRLDPSIVQARLAVIQKVPAAVPLPLSCYRRYVQQAAEFVSRIS